MRGVITDSLTLASVSKQLAKLSEFGIYRTDLTKGEASDLLGQLFIIR